MKKIFFWHIIILFLLSCGDKTPYKIYECGGEKINGNTFIGKGGSFKNTIARTQTYYKSGEYGFECLPDRKIGPILELPSLSPGDQLTVSVWMRGKDIQNSGILLHHIESNRTITTNQVIDQQDQWYFVRDTFVIPDDFSTTTCAVYPMLFESETPVYFDDFKVIHKPARKENKKMDYISFQPVTLDLFLKSDDYLTIEKKREEAMSKGLLFTSRKDLVTGQLKIKDQTFKVDTRLKGDLLDHLQGKKWSFRIEMDNNDTWRNMQKFSIHNSLSRSHLAEWIMHKIFTHEDIITPAYDFCRFQLNEKDLGVYAYEQHFDNYLLLENKKPIAPIIKHNDEAYWHNVNKELTPFYWTDASQFELFNDENKDSDGFMDHYQTGKSMLNDFLLGKKSANEVFAMDKMAKYYALLELSHAVHAQAFTNIRFYFHPYTGKLEPIAFDCFGDYLPNVNQQWRAIGEGISEDPEFLYYFPAEDKYQIQLFRDTSFYSTYLSYLETYTSPDYLNNLKKDWQTEIDEREGFIRTDKEYEEYSFNWDDIFKKADFTRKKIYPLPEYSLKAYEDEINNKTIHIQSFHYFPMEIIGHVRNGDTIWLDNPIYIPGYSMEGKIESITISLDKKFDEVLVRTLGTKKYFPFEVLNDILPRVDIPINKNLDISDLDKLEYLERSDSIISFKAGSHVIKNPLIFSAAIKAIQIYPGTELVFINQGCIVSHAPIKAIGSRQQPITFRSNDRLPHGILIAGCTSPSVLTNCIFSELEGIQQAPYFSQGALTVFDAPLELERSSFNAAYGKSALILDKAAVQINELNFHTNYGNAINMRYCKGNLNDLSFKLIASNAIQVFESDANITGVNFDEISNTCISVEGNSKIRLENLHCANSKVALSVTDGGNVDGYNINWNNIDIGIKALGKNSRANIYGENRQNHQIEYLLDEIATLTINGRAQTPR